MAAPDTIIEAPQTWAVLLDGVVDGTKLLLQNTGAEVVYLYRGDTPPPDVGGTADLSNCVQLDPRNGFAGMLAQNIFTGAIGAKIYGWSPRNLSVLLGSI